MSNTILRQWAMLKSVPREPRKIDTRSLRQLLEQEGFNISQRSIQRDLNKLSKVFPGLQSDGNRDVAGWFWKSNTAVQDFPAIDPPMALTFKLAESFLGSLRPPSVMDRVRPYLDASDKVLESIDEQGYRNWASKVAVVPRTQPLIPAVVDPEVLRVIYDALLHQKRFKGWYKPRGKAEAEYDFKPYGIVYRDSVIYLVGAVWNYDDPLQYALHRFRKCEPLDEGFEIPGDFNLDEYIASGAFEYVVGDGKPFRLTAVFLHEAGMHLFETPLSKDQKIIRKRDGRLQVSATVNNTQQLRWWLLGFGSGVRVVAPAWLKRELGY